MRQIFAGIVERKPARSSEEIEAAFADAMLKEDAYIKEHNRCLMTNGGKPITIKVECSDGVWIREAWDTGKMQGWHDWRKEENN